MVLEVRELAVSDAGLGRATEACHLLGIGEGQCDVVETSHADHLAETELGSKEDCGPSPVIMGLGRNEQISPFL